MGKFRAPALGENTVPEHSGSGSLLYIFIIFIISLYRVIPNCFCKLKGMIEPLLGDQ